MPKLHAPKLSLQEVQDRVNSMPETEAKSLLVEMLIDADKYQTVLVCMASRLVRTGDKALRKPDLKTRSFEDELFAEIKTNLDCR